MLLWENSQIHSNTVSRWLPLFQDGCPLILFLVNLVYNCPVYSCYQSIHIWHTEKTDVYLWRGLETAFNRTSPYPGLCSLCTPKVCANMRLGSSAAVTIDRGKLLINLLALVLVRFRISIKLYCHITLRVIMHEILNSYSAGPSK